MSTTSVTSYQTEIRTRRGSLELCAALRAGQANTVHLAGADGFAEGWKHGPLVGIEPTLCWERRVRDDAGASTALAELDRLVLARRGKGGTAETGVLALLGYELLAPAATPDPAARRLPEIVVLTVDRSLRFIGDRHALLTCSPHTDLCEPGQLVEDLDCLADPGPARAAKRVGKPLTSLPRRRYLHSVERVQRHIAAGDIYQANLCQRFLVPYEGDVFALHRDLVRRSPAPHAAFVETPSFALASASPETFLHVTPEGEIETLPIKGTRPRGATAEEDRAAAEALLESPKDRAELLMIVDLERNDLGRVCRTGSVEVPELAALRSFAAVHHLVARVRGRLTHRTPPSRLIRATFPGGSITGAPKIRAMQVLGDLEPVPRKFFTGSLLWFGDDGSLDSSILIRTIEFTPTHALLGAGGGVVADSDPEQEWQESNHKARALATALGFDPEEVE